MGNADSHQRLGERVVASKAKLEQDKAVQSERYEYLRQNSPEILDAMIKSIADSFQSCSPFMEPTLLISWMHDPQKCRKIVLDSCRRVLNAPIHKEEYQWFKDYLFSSSLWMLKTKENKYMYQELLAIAKTMSHDIIDSMDSIYNHLESHRKWIKMLSIQNISAVTRQDDPKVGLLRQQGLKEVFESKLENEKAAEMKTFIDSNLAINILTSTATNINQEFQTHIENVMSKYGEFKSGPMKKVERCVSKLENNYQDAEYPKAAKLLDLVRCSVTFNTVDQLLNGYNGLMRYIANHNDTIELARIKNGFLNKGQGGYRDIKVNVIYKSQINPSLNMICEIQLLLINYLTEKKRIHKLYSIVREEIYFQMVVQQETSAKDGDKDQVVTELKFIDLLNVGKEVALNYTTENMNKCSVDPDLGFLCMEGIDWFGVIDIKQKKAILEQQRDSPRHPWYGRQSHQWISINGQKHLSVQTGKTEIKMFTVTAENQFIENEKFQISIPSTADSVINYCDFDKKFENIIIIINDTILQKRSMEDVNNVTHSIELEEKINQSSFRNLRLSDDGTMAGLGGGGYKDYFYLIDIDNDKQFKLTSKVLSDTYSPCFINGETNFISVSDKKGRIEIWDVNKRKAINTLSIGCTEWVTSAASTNDILAIGSWDKKLRLYDVASWECFYEREYHTKPSSLHLTDDLKYLTLAGSGGDRCYVLKIEN